jgi:phage pi2 protein 07
MVSIWISRLTLGSGGNEGTCSINIDRKKIKKEILDFKSKVEPIKLDSYEQITLSELVNELNDGRLRQGWGLTCENLNADLRGKNEEEWVINYIKLKWKIFSEEVKCDYVCGRYKILSKMLNINQGDVIFIPNIPNDEWFTVATVTSGYEFKARKNWNNFGHVINVEKIQPFKYHEIFNKLFFNPYRRAVSKVEDETYYSLLNDYLTEHYKNTP